MSHTIEALKKVFVALNHDADERPDPMAFIEQLGRQGYVIRRVAEPEYGARFTIPPSNPKGQDEEQSNARQFHRLPDTTLTLSEVEVAIRHAEAWKRAGRVAAINTNTPAGQEVNITADQLRRIKEYERGQGWAEGHTVASKGYRMKARQEIAKWLRDTALFYWNKPGHVLEHRAMMIAADMLQRAINSRE